MTPITQGEIMLGFVICVVHIVRILYVCTYINPSQALPEIIGFSTFITFASLAKSNPSGALWTLSGGSPFVANFTAKSKARLTSETR